MNQTADGFVNFIDLDEHLEARGVGSLPHAALLQAVQDEENRHSEEVGAGQEAWGNKGGEDLGRKSVWETEMELAAYKDIEVEAYKQ